MKTTRLKGLPGTRWHLRTPYGTACGAEANSNRTSDVKSTQFLADITCLNCWNAVRPRDVRHG